MLIRSKNATFAVAQGHGYTVEKVSKALKFINSAGRNTKVQEWVEMYNYLKNTSDKIEGCKPCAAAKYTASVRNYAKYGYLTLLNEGHKPEEFGIGEKKTQEPIENEEKRIVLEEPKVEEPKEATEVAPLSEGHKEDAVIEEVKEALQEEPVTSENEVIVNEMSDVQEEATEEPQEEAAEEPKQEEVVEEPKPKRGRKSSK